MNLRRTYELLTRRRDPLDLDAMLAVDALAAVLKSQRAADAIVRTLRERPDLWDEDAGTVAAVLAALDDVGPAAAATFVMVEVYAGHRHELEAPASTGRSWYGDRRVRDDGPAAGHERRSSVGPETIEPPIATAEPIDRTAG